VTGGLGSQRVFATGITGGGKTDFLRRYFLRHQPRLLILDNTGEWPRKLEGCRGPYHGLDATYRALRAVAGRRTWRVIATLSNEELAELTVRLLVPVPDIERGYAFAVGGMGLVVDEVDLVVPGTQGSAELRNLWQRGRHARLSVYAATQRPSGVSKLVTSMCEWLVMLRLAELRDVAYMEQRLGGELYAWAARHVFTQPYGALLYHVHRRTGWLIDKDGRMLDTKTPALYAGEESTDAAD